jgi:hypothetical protein
MTNVLSPRALNRALLARQMLLERSTMPVADAVGFLLGMQAQVPTDPYVGLWSRLADFDPQALSRLIEQRAAVRVAAMRGTVHLMLAEDALELRPLTQPVFERSFPHTPFGKGARGADRAKVVAAARKAIEAKPMTLVELRKVLEPMFPPFKGDHLAYLVHYAAPLVQVPPRGMWGKSSAPKVTTLDHWVGSRLVMKPSIDAIVLRYLAAFGPASVMDAQSWSGLTKLGPVFEKLRPKLVTFEDNTGRELFDLPKAPQPNENAPAPPRFLPVYDNLTLGFANRDRILNLQPKTPPAQNTWVKTFTVDGFVAGFWKIEGGALELDPWRPLTKKESAALAAEGRRLVRFMEGTAKAEVRFVS